MPALIDLAALIAFLPLAVNTLAERTFDANGDFVMKQFTHSFREHLNDGSFNRGFYEAYQGGKEEQFVPLNEELLNCIFVEYTFVLY